MMRRAVLLALFLIGGPAAVSAQPAPDKARAQVGPFSLNPQLILRDVGTDSNVFNEAADPKQDFTATVGAKLDVTARLSRLHGTYTSFYEYMYFRQYTTERGSNRGAEGRADVLLGRLRPYLAAGITSANDRPTAEIDERAHRQQTHVAGGLSVAPFSRTTLNVGYRRSNVDYADEERFRGVSLADELNGRADSITYGVDVELSPLTSVSLHGEQIQERFESSPERDADSYRAGITATLQPLALISGRASIGVRAYRPLSSLVREFTGLTAAVAVGYSLRSETRLNLTVDRDLRYSFEQLTPFYVSTGGRLTLTQRVIGSVDAQAFGGLERIAYEARLDAAVPSDRDRVRTLGGGIGYRVGDGARLALNFDHTERSSPARDRQYARRRLYTTLSYGL
jgi:hypothetical protein